MFVCCLFVFKNTSSGRLLRTYLHSVDSTTLIDIQSSVHELNGLFQNEHTNSKWKVLEWQGDEQDQRARNEFEQAIGCSFMIFSNKTKF